MRKFATIIPLVMLLLLASCNKETVIRLQLSQPSDAKTPTATIDGSVFSLDHGARDLASQLSAVSKPDAVLEIQVDPQVAYEWLAPILVAAKNTGIEHVRLTTDGSAFVDSTSLTMAMPRHKVAASFVCLKKSDHSTQVNVDDGKFINLETQGDRILQSLADLKTSRVYDCVVVVQAQSHVPSKDVLAVYGYCLKTGFSRIALAPAAESENLGKWPEDLDNTAPGSTSRDTGDTLFPDIKPGTEAPPLPKSKPAPTPPPKTKKP